MPNLLPENWKNGATQAERQSGRTGLARHLSVWLGLSVAAMGGIWKVAQTTNRYTAQGANPAPQTPAAAGVAGTWNTTTTQFWLPATPGGPLWNSGAEGDEGSASAPGHPIAVGTNLLEWEVVFKKGQTAFSGSPLASLGVDPLGSSGGIDWSTVATVEGDEAGGGDADASPEMPFGGRGRRGIFADFNSLPGLFDLAAVNDESGLDAGMFAPDSGFDSFTLSANLVPITRVSLTSNSAPAPVTSGGDRNPANSFFTGSTLGLNGGPVPIVGTNASGPRFSASGGDILPPSLPEFTGAPPPPVVRFRTARVKVYDAGWGATGSTGTTTGTDGTITNGLATGGSAVSGLFPSSPAPSSGAGTTTFTGGGTINFSSGGELSMSDAPASGATLSTLGAGTFTNSAVVSMASASTIVSFKTSTATVSDETFSSALVTSSVTPAVSSPAPTSAPTVLRAETVGSTPTGTTLTSNDSPATTQVLLASLGTPNQILSMTSAGTAGTTFASNPSSNLSNPNGLAFSLTGNLYVANNGNNTIERFLLAPNGQTGSDAGTFATASSGLNSPAGLAVDSSGNLYVANNATLGTNANSILKITPGGSASVFAGVSANLNEPLGLAFDNAGNLYVSNSALTGTNANTILKITPSGVVSTFITADGINLSEPTGLVFDSLGNLYVSYAGSGVVEKYSAAGVDEGAYVNESSLDFPEGLAFDSNGNLFVANAGGPRSVGPTIDEFTSQGATPIVWASTTLDPGFNDPEFLAFANVPEPGSAWLLLSGVAGLGCWRRRRRAGRKVNPSR